eukprot:14056477-Alexandrium_andersonii.AAC.1
MPASSRAARASMAGRCPAARPASQRSIFRQAAAARFKNTGGPHHAPSRKTTAPMAAEAATGQRGL